MRTTILLHATLLVGLVAVPAANAVDRPILAQANGSGACQAALPNYEGQIRKRPLAIQNEGTLAAFVTCSPLSLMGNPLHTSGHGLTLINMTKGSIQVNCTGVSGPPFAATYMPKTVLVPANGTASLNWLGADGVSELNMHAISMSCSIQPGIGVHDVHTRQVVDVGE